MYTPPDILTFLLANVVYLDPVSRWHSILGIYSTLTLKKFPSEPMTISAFVEMIGGHGRVPMAMRIVDVDEARPPMFDYAVDVNFVDPLLVAHVTFTGRNRIFPAPGQYRVQLYAGNDLLKERRLLVE